MTSDEKPPPAEVRRYRRPEQVTSRAKTDAVLRLLKGESVDLLSEELNVSINRIERWKARFLEAGSAELARRTDVASDSWMGRNADSIRQWVWLLLILVAVVSLLAVFMQRGSAD